MYDALTRLTRAKTGRASSWDPTGRNRDWWGIEPGETRILADLRGPGAITHIWMTQPNHYRECRRRRSRLRRSGNGCRSCATTAAPGCTTRPGNAPARGSGGTRK